MISRRLSAWQKVVALAPLLLLAVSRPGQVLLRCQDGILRSSCCCPPEKGAPSSTPVLTTQDCCDREVTVNEPARAEPSRKLATDLVAAAILCLPAPIALVAGVVGRAPPGLYSHGPPRGGPSIVLLKHSFLI